MTRIGDVGVAKRKRNPSKLMKKMINLSIYYPLYHIQVLNNSSVNVLSAGVVKIRRIKHILIL